MLENDIHLYDDGEGFAFLAEKELRMLSGYQQKARQRKWLQQNGIAFIVNKLGYPVVSRASVMEQLSPRRGRPAPRNSPDLEALRNLNNGSKKAH